MNRVAEQFTTSRSDGARQEQKSSQPSITGRDIRQLIGPVEKLVLDYPGVALASAFIIGVTIGWLIKRK